MTSHTPSMEEVAEAYREAVKRCYGDAILRYSDISHRGRWFYVALAVRDKQGNIEPSGYEHAYSKERLIEMTQELMKRAEQQDKDCN